MPKLQTPPAVPELKPFAITVRLDSEIASAVYQLSKALRVTRTDAIRILLNQGITQVAGSGISPLGLTATASPRPAKVSA